MKIKYEFVNETQEIEVSEEWAAVLAELDRREYNNDQRESRRHCSLEAYDPEGERIAAGDDIEDNVITLIENGKLYAAMKRLSPRQKRLIEQVYFERKSIAEVARNEGRDWSTIKESLTRAEKNLKKFLN